MEKPGGAGPVDKSQESENQDKIVNMCFGIFFDAFESNIIGNYREQGSRWKDEQIGNITNSDEMLIGSAIYDMVVDVANKLPGNAVTDAINKVDALKKDAENAINSLNDKIDELNDSNLGLGEVSNECVNDGDDMLGSGRSVISRMEPSYMGDINGDLFETKYNYKIYIQGAINSSDLKKKEATESESPDENYVNSIVTEVKTEVESKIKAGPQAKLSLHFDIFGYRKDPAVNKFIPEVDTFSQIANVNEVNIEYKGLYENYYAPKEVNESLGSARARFGRNYKIE
jgi:hypothetical protein